MSKARRKFTAEQKAEVVRRVVRDKVAVSEPGFRCAACSYGWDWAAVSSILGPHKHWHTDISYLNLGGTFYFFISVLDGYSRSIVHWEITEKMEEKDVEQVIQRALERHPGAKPRIISDNGPQFIAKDFKVFIRLTGLTRMALSTAFLMVS